MINYKQNNPRWNRTKIRGTNISIGEYGCLICCIATLSTDFGQGFGPQGAMDLTGFTKDGKVIWRSGIYTDFEFEKIVKGYDREAIINALNDPNRAVILGLNGAKHWVVASDIDPTTGDLQIADPLGKNERDILGKNDVIDYMAFYKRKET